MTPGGSDDRAARSSHGVRAAQETALAEAIIDKEMRADHERINRYEATLRDKRSGQVYATTGSDPFITLDKLRLAMGRPELVMTGEPLPPDDWGMVDCP